MSYQACAYSRSIPRGASAFRFPRGMSHKNTWAAFERKLDDAFAAAKASYREDVKALPDDGKTKAIGKHSQDHFEWLVLYQLGDVAFADIYNEYRTACHITLCCNPCRPLLVTQLPQSSLPSTIRSSARMVYGRAICLRQFIRKSVLSSGRAFR